MTFKSTLHNRCFGCEHLTQIDHQHPKDLRKTIYLNMTKKIPDIDKNTKSNEGRIICIVCIVQLR